MSNEAVTKLVGNAAAKREGDFVHQNQPMNRTFQHVSDLFAGRDSRYWKDGTIRTFSQLLEDIENEKSIRYDVPVRPEQLTAVLDESGNFAMRVNAGDFDGVDFYPSKHVVSQLGSPALSGYGSTVINHLMDGDDEEQKLCVDLVNKSLKNWNEARKALKGNNLLRLRIPTKGEASIRTIVTEQFARIDHNLLVETVAEAIPDGIATHVRWDGGDTLRFNGLIPDWQRVDDDSEFGGMIACRNSEIGTGRIWSQPSLFRAICMNGCIWGRIEGKAASRVHKGKINLVEYKAAVLQNLQTQIPLIETGYNRTRVLRDYSFDASPEQMVTTFANGKLVVSKGQARTLLQAYGMEPVRSAYGFINAITRAAQAFGNSVQEDWEVTAGDYLNSWSDPDRGRNKWDSFVHSAHNVDTKDVDKLLLVG